MLHVALLYGNDVMVHMLVDRGADVNAPNAVSVFVEGLCYLSFRCLIPCRLARHHSTMQSAMQSAKVQSAKVQLR